MSSSEGRSLQIWKAFKVSQKDMRKHSWQSLCALTWFEFLNCVLQAAEHSEQDFERVVHAPVLSLLYFLVCDGFSTVLLKARRQGALSTSRESLQHCLSGKSLADKYQENRFLKSVFETSCATFFFSLQGFSHDQFWMLMVCILENDLAGYLCPISLFQLCVQQLESIWKC